MYAPASLIRGHVYRSPRESIERTPGGGGGGCWGSGKISGEKEREREREELNRCVIQHRNLSVFVQTDIDIMSEYAKVNKLNISQLPPLSILTLIHFLTYRDMPSADQ